MQHKEVRQDSIKMAKGCCQTRKKKNQTIKESKRNPHYLATPPIKPSVSNTLYTRSRHSKGSNKKGTQASASQNKQLLKNPKVNTKRTQSDTRALLKSLLPGFCSPPASDCCRAFNRCVGGRTNQAPDWDGRHTGSYLDWEESGQCKPSNCWAGATQNIKQQKQIHGEEGGRSMKAWVHNN